MWEPRRSLAALVWHLHDVLLGFEDCTNFDRSLPVGGVVGQLGVGEQLRGAL